MSQSLGEVNVVEDRVIEVVTVSTVVACWRRKALVAAVVAEIGIP